MSIDFYLILVKTTTFSILLLSFPTNLFLNTLPFPMKPSLSVVSRDTFIINLGMVFVLFLTRYTSRPFFLKIHLPCRSLLCTSTLTRIDNLLLYLYPLPCIIYSHSHHLYFRPVIRSVFENR